MSCSVVEAKACVEARVSNLMNMSTFIVKIFCCENGYLFRINNILIIVPSIKMIDIRLITVIAA